VTSEGARLRAADPGHADSVFKAGATAVRNGLEAEALPLLEAGVAQHPADARLWQLLGLAYRNLEDLEPALKALDKAAALAPADALIAHTRARAALEAGLPAIDLFERARRLAPNDGAVILGALAALFAEGRLDDSIAALDRLLHEHPGWLEGHALAARLRWLRGEGRHFTSSFERALETAPRDIRLWSGMIETLMHAASYDEALAAVARGRAAAGPHEAFDAFDAACAAEKGETAKADRLFARLGPPKQVAMAVRHIRHLLRSGRPEQAAALAEPISGTKEGTPVWPYLSVAWRLLGDPRWQWLEGDERLVGIYDLTDRLPPLNALADRLRALHIATAQPLEQSVRGGTQTDGPLFARIEPEIRALRAAVVAAVERHIAQLPAPEPDHPTLIARRAPVRFSGSWSVRLQGAGFHANHVHPAGWISSALYVSLPPTGAGHEGWLAIGQPQAELGIDLPPTRLVQPRPGRLVLFPSTMWHGTIPFEAGERLTVAFDVARPV